MTVPDEDFFRLQVLVRQLQARVRWGAGSPEGVVDAPKGAVYENETSGALYRKTSVSGIKTGWVTP